ncbi:hypothetical protein D918_01118 [Trichuris suis]|nr:hypothetical protein D918_01118 [Trichuris suis]
MRSGSPQKQRQSTLRCYEADLISRYVAAEWYHLKSAIQSRERNLCLSALDIINVMKKKFGSGMPLVLRATETALQAVIFDQKYESEAVDDDEHGLNETFSRFTFSFALSR